MYLYTANYFISFVAVLARERIVETANKFIGESEGIRTLSFSV